MPLERPEGHVVTFAKRYCTLRGVSIAEFEEKEFEGPLNGQLGLGGLLWPPGQVLENIVGFDVAMFTAHAVFWAARGYTAPPQGAVISPAWWPLASALLAQRSPPTFRMNVFLQYKRPEFLFRSSASEWSSWNAAYFRFWITLHQQIALDACAAALGQNGLVAYASPTFHTRVALFGHVEHQTLLANTHFAPAAHLTGHGRYTYVDAVTPGIAHSEPITVKPLTVLNGGGNGDGPPDRPPGGEDGRPPEQLLADARRAARAAVAASPQLVGSQTLFAAAVDRAVMISQAIGTEVGEPVRDFVYAAMFSRMSGIQWALLPAAA